MANSQELTISDIRGSVTKSGPDVYVEFRLGDRTASTGVVKHAEEKIEFTEPVTLAANEGGRGSQAKSADELIVRAYDKHALLPDTLLGRATVALSGLQLGDASVAGSGGGANVQVQLLGKKGAFGGALDFTITGTEGLSGVPGGSEFGPQEVAGDAGGPTAAETPTTGVPGAGGATAFPAAAAGKSLGGEHLSDYEQGSAGQGSTGQTGMLHKGDEELAAAALVPAAAAAAAAGHGHSEPQQQPQQGSSGAVGPTTGVPGEGGATAYPAAASGRDLGGEHLSDYQQGGSAGNTGMLREGGTSSVAAPAAAGAAGAGAAGAAGMQGQQGQGSGGGDESHLTVSDIGAKLTREDDILGRVTPYLVFEVDGEREHTSKLGGIKALEQLTWPETLELDIGQGAPSELHVLAYNKKLLPVPDGVLGEARAALEQLPRGRQARLILKDTKAIGNLAGEVTFTLSGGGPGGSGAGDDPPLSEDLHGLSLAGASGPATGEEPSHSEQ